MFQTNRSFGLCVLLVFLIAACFGATAQDANAGAIPTFPTFTMADAIVPDAFIETASGRFRFDNFSYSAVPPGGPAPDPEDVFVTITETDDMVMLLFQIVEGNLVMAPDTWDMQVGYQATTLNENETFVGHTLSTNSNVLFGDGFVILNEEILTPDGSNVAELTVFDNLPGQPDRSMDHADFVPTRSIVVVDKDLVANGGTEEGGVAFVSHFKQTFHTQIPEPSGLALLVLGCIGLGFVGWYSRRIG